MKILFLSSYVDPGSGASILIRLADKLEDNGHEVKILTRQGGFESDIIEVIPTSKIIDLLSKVFYKFAPNHLAFGYSRLLDKIDAFNPDVINIHWTHGRRSIPIQLIPRLSKKYPLFWTIHDIWPITGNSFFEFSGGELLSQKITWVKKVLQCFELPQEVFLRYKIHLLSELTIHTISPSKWLFEKVQSGPVFGSAISHHIPNGVDVNVFKPLDTVSTRGKYGLDKKEKVILFLSANVMDERKGFYYFSKALEYLDSTNRKLIENTTVLLVGDCSKGVSKYLPTKVKNLGSTRDLSRLVEYYNAADIFVSASLADNFPSTSLESLACGTPVVAFDVGGVSEIVIDHQTGLLSKSRDVKGLANNIQKMLTSDVLGRELSENCRNYAVSNLNLDKCANRYIELFKLGNT